MADTWTKAFGEDPPEEPIVPDFQKMVTIEITQEAHNVLTELFDNDKVTNESQAIIGQLEFAQHLVGIINSFNEDTKRLNAELAALKKEKESRIWLPS